MQAYLRRLGHNAQTPATTTRMVRPMPEIVNVRIPRVMCGMDGAEMVIYRTGEIMEMIAGWGPYYKITGDRFRCPDCNAMVFLPAAAPLAEHYQPGYADIPASTVGKLS